MHQPERWHTVTGKGMCALMCDVTSQFYQDLYLSYQISYPYGRALKEVLSVFINIPLPGPSNGIGAETARVLAIHGVQDVMPHQIRTM
ncbi:hypothetical protein C5167_038467 [Papaver somniferum]|uniref:Uncharacterized protein n=1 Tax=Papaver somniferum TaxID=3469 RepID=A0A4Y7ICP0_PAPSO|nr:hypothetical protein C5167_038467 [Papaver somniferum]